MKWFRKPSTPVDTEVSPEVSRGADVSDDEALQMLAYGPDSSLLPAQFWSGSIQSIAWNALRFLARRVSELEAREAGK